MANIWNDNKKHQFWLRTHSQILQIATEQRDSYNTPQRDSIVEEGGKEAEFGPKLSQIQQQRMTEHIHEYKEEFGLGRSNVGRIDKYP